MPEATRLDISNSRVKILNPTPAKFVEDFCVLLTCVGTGQVSDLTSFSPLFKKSYLL